MLTEEVERRDAKMLEQRIRGANFEHSRTLEDFDFQFHFNPQLPGPGSSTWPPLALWHNGATSCSSAPSGVGTSHIAQALGQRACRLGHQVLVVTVHDMLGQLRAARGDGSHERKLLRFTSPALLILDELGLRQLAPEETVDLHDVFRLRYERGSIVLTSNRALEELPAIEIHHPTSGRPSATPAAARRLHMTQRIESVQFGALRAGPRSRSARGAFSRRYGWPAGARLSSRPRGCSASLHPCG